MTMEQLDAYLRALEAAGWVPARMRPGLPAANVIAELKAAGLSAPGPLIELYGFSDGAPMGEFFASGFRSLQEAIEARAEHLRRVDPDDPEPPYRPGFLPVFTSDPELVVDTDDPGAAVFTLWWDTPTELVYPNIAAFVRGRRERLENGEIEVRDGQVLRRVPPPPEFLPLATVTFRPGTTEPTKSVFRVAAALPEYFVESGADAFTILSLANGAVANNDNLEEQQTAVFRDIVERVDGIEQFAIEWVVSPGIPTGELPRHVIRIQADLS